MLSNVNEILNIIIHAEKQLREEKKPPRRRGRWRILGLFDGDDLVLIVHQFRDENTMEKLPLNKNLIEV